MITDAALGRFASIFSATWSLHCADLPIRDAFSKAVGFRRLFDRGYEVDLGIYLLDLTAQQQAKVDGLVVLAEALSRARKEAK